LIQSPLRLEAAFNNTQDGILVATTYQKNEAGVPGSGKALVDALGLCDGSCVMYTDTAWQNSTYPAANCPEIWKTQGYNTLCRGFKQYVLPMDTASMINWITKNLGPANSSVSEPN
jgi:hypothetical protein